MRSLSPDDKVAGMRKDIDIELVRDARNQITAFNVSYTSRDPRLAQQVTGELTNLFINQNLEVRQQQSEDTTQFLESQLEAARKDLADQEDRVRQFKAQHVGEMPGQLASNLQILQGLQSQLQTAEDSLNAARQQRVYLANPGGPVPHAAGAGEEFGWNSGWTARDRSTTAETQVATC